MIVEHFVVVDDNQPWPQFSARSLVKQFGAHDVLVHVLDCGSSDGSVDEFQAVFAEEGFHRYVIDSCGSRSWPDELLKMIADTSAEFVSIQGANNLWLTSSALERSLVALNSENLGFVWHPVLIRGAETMAVFPSPSDTDWGSSKPSWECVPWQSLVFRSSLLAGVDELRDSIGLIELRNRVVSSAHGRFVPQISMLIENSAGRGRRNLSLAETMGQVRDSASVSGRYANLTSDLMSLFRSGALVMDDVIVELQLGLNS